MEKLKFIIPILLLSLSSCINTTPRYNDVKACFVVTGDIHYKNEAVSFVNCSQYAEEYEWNFGDGTTLNQRDPTHVYTTPGTYQVSLTAYGYNTMETFTDAVSVLDINVVACFVVTGDVHYVNEAVNFVDCSEFVEEYEWSFGDGATSNQRNPSHVYTTPGTYQVSLTVYGYNNTMETFTDAVTVLGVVTTADLDILVMYEGTQDPVTACDVQLYDDFDNWTNLEFPISDILTTGSDGIVVFYDLDPITYFIDAYKYVSETSYYMNVDGETLPLDEGVVNYYNVYVQYFTETKSDRKHYSVTKIEKTSKSDHDRIIKENKLKQ